jgi:hypothetical protein
LAAASGAFATYSDSDTFIEGGTVGAPATDVPVAFGSLDFTGNGAALAALAYNPMFEAPGAVNSLAGTSLPADELAGRFRAKVSGRPTKEARLPGLAPGGASGAARLAPGPVAEATVTATRTEPAPAIRVAGGDNQARVDGAGGRTASTADAQLRDVTLGGVLTLRSVQVRAAARADGDASRSEATVVVEGAAVNGVAVTLTAQGVEASGEHREGDAEAVRQALTQAGIELMAPGAEQTDHGPEHAHGLAVGPRFAIAGAGGHRLEVTLGRAEAESTVVPGSHSGPSPEASSSEAPGVPAATGAPGARPASPLASAPPLVPATANAATSTLAGRQRAPRRG